MGGWGQVAVIGYDFTSSVAGNLPPVVSGHASKRRRRVNFSEQGRIRRGWLKSARSPKSDWGQIAGAGSHRDHDRTRQSDPSHPAVTRQEFTGIALSLLPREIRAGTVELKITASQEQRSESAVPVFTDSSGKVFESPILEEAACMATFAVPNDRVMVMPAFVPVSPAHATPAAKSGRYLLFVFHPTFEASP